MTVNHLTLFVAHKNTTPEFKFKRVIRELGEEPYNGERFRARSAPVGPEAAEPMLLTALVPHPNLVWL